MGQRKTHPFILGRAGLRVGNGKNVKKCPLKKWSHRLLGWITKTDY